MSNFGKEQLQKHGWTEGKGLGINEDGISQPIKPTLKFDNAGIGYKETFDTHWSQSVYDNAVKNMIVQSNGDQISLSVKNDNAFTLSKKKQNEKNEPNIKYTNFVKATDTNDDSSHLVAGAAMPCTFEESERRETATNLISTSVIDEQLYAACGGRTMHKAARHGLTLNGKLERIAQQDKMLLDSRVSSCSITASSTLLNIIDNKRHLNYKLRKYQDRILREHDLSKGKPMFLTDARKDCTEKMSKLVQELSTCNLKEDDAKSKREAPINKRKRNQDCIIQIDPLEMKNIFFFKKKPKTALDLNLEEIIRKIEGNQEHESHCEQIEIGIKKLNIKQKANEQEIQQESGSASYETNKINKQRQSSRQCIGSRVFKYSNLVNMWNKMRIMEIEIMKKERESQEYLLIKRIFEVNRHFDLSSNIERCVRKYPWIEILLQKLYSKVIKQKFNFDFDLKNICKQKKVEKMVKRLKSRKIRTQTHLTPV
ncbi:G patch domain-containing protein 4 [Linepithema humile]|uniref:G patch domain-containing protein 4 n=1 Tax=Linepithema humile TaxID=83485 RepID=UPI00351EC0BB